MKRDRSNVVVNSDMGGPLVGLAAVQEFCRLDRRGRDLMRVAAQQLDLSAQDYHRVLKLGRTIADLAGEEAVQAQHATEVLKYRGRPHV